MAGAAGWGDAVGGQNVPASRIPGGLYQIEYDGQITGDVHWFDGDYGAVLYLGGYLANGGQPATPLLTTQDALSIDHKIDDGKPGSGSVMTWKHGNGYDSNCASTTDPATAVYDMTQGGAQCFLMFKMGF